MSQAAYIAIGCGMAMPFVATKPLAHRTRLGFFFFLCITALLWWPLTNAQPTPTPTPLPTLSGCQVCAASGDCSHAYLDGPGQYCGPWFNQANEKQHCCCPHEATCKVSTHICKCPRDPEPPAPVPNRNAPDAKTISTSGWIGVAMGSVVFISCGVGLCWCMVRVATRQQKKQAGTRPLGGTVPGAVPVAVPVQAVYASGADQYPYAMAPSAPVYDYGNDGDGHHNYRHHHSNLSSGLGAVAGLVTGMVIADIVIDGFSGDGGNAAYDSGTDSGGYSGGGDGDFGGDF